MQREGVTREKAFQHAHNIRRAWLMPKEQSPATCLWFTVYIIKTLLHVTLSVHSTNCNALSCL